MLNFTQLKTSGLASLLVGLWSDYCNFSTLSVDRLRKLLHHPDLFLSNKGYTTSQKWRRTLATTKLVISESEMHGRTNSFLWRLDPVLGFNLSLRFTLPLRDELEKRLFEVVSWLVYVFRFGRKNAFIIIRKLISESFFKKRPDLHMKLYYDLMLTFVLGPKEDGSIFIHPRRHSYTILGRRINMEIASLLLGFDFSSRLMGYYEISERSILRPLWRKKKACARVNIYHCKKVPLRFVS